MLPFKIFMLPFKIFKRPRKVIGGIEKKEKSKERKKPSIGFWSFLAGATVAIKAKNMMTRPSVNFIRGEGEIIGMENKGLTGSEWKIWYTSKKGGGSHQSFTINKHTRSGTAGGNSYKVFWPGK